MKTGRMFVFVLVFTSIFTIFTMYGCKNKSEVNLMDVEYSENIETISYYFNELDDIERVFFKSVSIGKNGLLGPSSFSVVGFICIAEDEKNLIYNDYEFSEGKPCFPDGISPSITGFDNYEWKTSQEFSQSILKGNFAGDVYIDINNSVIFINVQNT